MQHLLSNSYYKMRSRFRWDTSSIFPYFFSIYHISDKNQYLCGNSDFHIRY